MRSRRHPVMVIEARAKWRGPPPRGRMLNGDWGVGCQVPLEDIVAETYRSIRASAPLLSCAPTRFGEEDSNRRDVLLVDEDTERRRALARALKREVPSVRVHELDRASEALSWCGARTPALVLTELTFRSGATAGDLFDLLRQPGRRPAQLIATSALSRIAARAEQLSHRDIAFLPKPFDISYAVGMIAGALRAGPRRRPSARIGPNLHGQPPRSIGAATGRERAHLDHAPQTAAA